MYDSDRRLTLKIVESMPRIKLRVSNNGLDDNGGSADNVLPCSMISGEIIEIEIEIKNFGNLSASNIWINSNQKNRFQISELNQTSIFHPGADSTLSRTKLKLSSLPGPICIGSLAAGESRLLKTKLLMQTTQTGTNSGRNLIEICVYCQDDQLEQFIPQSVIYYDS